MSPRSAGGMAICATRAMGVADEMFIEAAHALAGSAVLNSRRR